MVPADDGGAPLRRHPLRQPRPGGAPAVPAGPRATSPTRSWKSRTCSRRSSQVPEQRAAILDDLGDVLDWGPDMDYRLRDLDAEQLASALIAGIEKPARGGRAVAPRSSTGCRRFPTTSSSATRSSSWETASIRGSMATAGAAAGAAPLRLRLSQYHPRFASPDGGRSGSRSSRPTTRRPSSYARMRPTLEGGDMLVLREDLLAIGYSERTEKTTIERLAESLQEPRLADQADPRGRDSAGALVHAPRHGFHDDLAGRVPGVRADDPAGRRRGGRRLSSAT